MRDKECRYWNHCMAMTSCNKRGTLSVDWAKYGPYFCADYEPMPDVEELAKVADEIERADVDGCVGWHERIRKACGIEHEIEER